MFKEVFLKLGARNGFSENGCGLKSLAPLMPTLASGGPFCAVA